MAAMPCIKITINAVIQMKEGNTKRKIELSFLFKIFIIKISPMGGYLL